MARMVRVCALLAAVHLVTAVADPQVIFFDDFDGTTLNTSRWNKLEQPWRGGVYSADMVTVQNGMLVLTTEPRNQTIDGSDYYVASGAVNTSHLFAHQYGLFEARVRLPDVDSTQGYTLHSSFWLLEEEGCHQEIDIFEQYASAGAPIRSRIAGNVHAYGPNATCAKAPSAVAYDAEGDWTSDWHVYGLDWRANSIEYYIDGTSVGNFSSQPALQYLNSPEFILLTACVMERVPVTASDVFPQRYLVDWVRVTA